MFRKDLLIHKPIAERLQQRIKEGNYQIKMEMGGVDKEEMVVVKFEYKNYCELSGLIREAISEEYDLMQN